MSVDAAMKHETALEKLGEQYERQGFPPPSCLFVDHKYIRALEAALEKALGYLSDEISYDKKMPHMIQEIRASVGWETET